MVVSNPPDESDMEMDSPDRADEALAALDTIDTAGAGSMDGYDRDEFDVWASQGHGCDTRAEVLKETSDTEVDTNEYCTVQTGEWDGAYTGDTFTDAGDLDIDHLVPLSRAWRHGASEWPDDLREEFGNDTEHGNLVVVESSENREKSDQGPGGWLPGHDECGYAVRYTLTVDYWDDQAHEIGEELTITPDDAETLHDLLTECR